VVVHFRLMDVAHGNSDGAILVKRLVSKSTPIDARHGRYLVQKPFEVFAPDVLHEVPQLLVDELVDVACTGVG
jgi:hypothetical protein